MYKCINAISFYIFAQLFSFMAVTWNQQASF